MNLQINCLKWLRQYVQRIAFLTFFDDEFPPTELVPLQLLSCDERVKKEWLLIWYNIHAVSFIIILKILFRESTLLYGSYKMDSIPEFPISIWVH